MPIKSEVIVKTTDLSSWCNNMYHAVDDTCWVADIRCICDIESIRECRREKYRRYKVDYDKCKL